MRYTRVGRHSLLDAVIAKLLDDVPPGAFQPPLHVQDLVPAPCPPHGGKPDAVGVESPVGQDQGDVEDAISWQLHWGLCGAEAPEMV